MHKVFILFLQIVPEKNIQNHSLVYYSLSHNGFIKSNYIKIRGMYFFNALIASPLTQITIYL